MGPGIRRYTGNELKLNLSDWASVLGYRWNAPLDLFEEDVFLPGPAGAAAGMHAADWPPRRPDASA